MVASSLGLGGHTYLPYPQAACREIEHHLLSLSAAFPSSSFEATLSPFTHDDGRDAILVNAAGALPVAGSHVSVWLVEAYQHAPPIVFMPVPDSETTRPAYIDSSGAVTAPYLRHWRWPDSDLVGLVQSLEVLVRLHHQPPMPQQSGEECATREVRRLDDAGTDTERALRALRDDKDRLEQELQMVSIKEAELRDAVAAERRAVEREAAEDALDRALQAGRLPLCRYLKEIKDLAWAQCMAWTVPSRPERRG